MKLKIKYYMSFFLFNFVSLFLLIFWLFFFIFLRNKYKKIFFEHVCNLKLEIINIGKFMIFLLVLKVSNLSLKNNT